MSITTTHGDGITTRPGSSDDQAPAARTVHLAAARAGRALRRWWENQRYLHEQRLQRERPWEYPGGPSHLR